MFSIAERERVTESLVDRARTDPRVVAGAAVGASAVGGDRWSDVDLTFGVAVGASVAEVLVSWTRALETEYEAVALFDVTGGLTIYRVFLLPGILQVDLSFAPAAEWGARGPRFRPLFGEEGTPPEDVRFRSEETFGLGVHHAVRAHVSIERGRPWLAEYWIHEARDLALTLACRRLGLDATYGRGFDDLPREVLNGLRNALARDLTIDGLRRALAAATDALLRGEGETSADARRLRPMLEELWRSTSL